MGWSINIRNLMPVAACGRVCITISCEAASQPAALPSRHTNITCVPDLVALKAPRIGLHHSDAPAVWSWGQLGRNCVHGMPGIGAVWGSITGLRCKGGAWPQPVLPPCPSRQAAPESNKWHLHWHKACPGRPSHYHMLANLSMSFRSMRVRVPNTWRTERRMPAKHMHMDPKTILLAVGPRWHST